MVGFNFFTLLTRGCAVVPVDVTVDGVHLGPDGRGATDEAARLFFASLLFGWSRVEEWAVGVPGAGIASYASGDQSTFRSSPT